MSGTTKGTFVGWMSEFPEEIPTYISNGISKLGEEIQPGDAYTFYRIYPIPEGVTGPNQGDPKEWIQTAGTAERLTVEVKRKEPDGSYRQYVIGRQSAAEETAESELIQFGEHQVPVRPSEVLTAAEAIGVFQHYYDHHTIPESWHLRELPQYADTSEQHTPASITDGAQPAPGTTAEQTADSAPNKPEAENQQQRQPGNA